MIKLRKFPLLFILFLSIVTKGQKITDHSVNKPAYDVAAFYWPAYHADERFKEISVFPDGKGEWEAIYKSKPKFDGEQVPKVPLWGYLDESDPKVMELKIDAATSY
jgi:hypothetical protein